MNLRFLSLAIAGCVVALGACKKQPNDAKPAAAAAADSPVSSESNGAGVSGDAVELKARWPAGARFKQRIETAQNGEMNIPNMPMPMKTSTTMSQDTSIQVLRDRPGGGREIEMIIDDMSMSMFQGDREIFGFDSKGDTTGGENPAAEAFQSLVGGKVQFFIDASNRVEKVEGVQPLIDGMRSKLRGPGLSVLSGMFSEDFFKQIGDFGHTLPGRPVRPGESWPSKTDISAGPMGRMTVSLQHTFKSWDQRAGRRAARIEFAGSITTKPEAGAERGGMAMSIDDGSISGTSWFDPERGQVIESLLDQSMNLRMSVPSPTGTATGPVSITNRMNQKISLKLTPVGA